MPCPPPSLRSRRALALTLTLPLSRTLSLALSFSLALAPTHALAQSTPQPDLSIIVPPSPPAGFDPLRLRRRVQVYVGSLAHVIDADADGEPHAQSPSGSTSASGSASDSTSPSPLQPRFIVQLAWPSAAMTPLDASISDTAVTPARSYRIEVSAAQSWDEFERLLALKLASVLRVALAPEPASAPAPAAAPAAPAAAEPGTATAEQPGARALRPLLEIGGGLVTSSAFDAPRLSGALGLALASGAWSFGIASTLAFRQPESPAVTSAALLETTWAAALRNDWSPASRWFVRLGAEIGVFAARLSADRFGDERVTYAVSPLASAVVLAGYRLAADGSALLLCGPAVDLLWTRAEIRAADAPLYDSGHIRYRGELKLVLAF